MIFVFALENESSCSKFKTFNLLGSLTWKDWMDTVQVRVSVKWLDAYLFVFVYFPT